MRSLTETRFVHEAFTSDALQAGGMALLPITAGWKTEPFRIQTAEAMNAQLLQAVPGGSTLSCEATLDSLNAHELVEPLQEALAGYRETSMFDRRRIQALREALGVRYALYCELQDVATAFKPAGFIASAKDIADLTAHCLVLDLQSGEVVQDIFGHARSRADKAVGEIPYQEYVETLVTSILAQLPGSAVVIVQTPEEPNMSAAHPGSVLTQ